MSLPLTPHEIEHQGILELDDCELECDDCNGMGFFYLWSADTGWVGHLCWLCKDDMKAMWE